MTTQTPNRTLDQIQSETDFSQLISKNKVLISAMVGVIVLAVVGVGIFSSFKKSSETQANAQIFDFTEKSLKEFSAGKLDANATVAAFKALKQKTGSIAGVVGVGAELSDELVKQNKLDLALEVLNMMSDIEKNYYAAFFVSSRKAVVQEDLGKIDDAIATLEGMLNMKLKVFEGKIYLDLGRLYSSKGNSEKAKASFKWVVDNEKEPEFVKVAKLYLDGMK